MLLLLLLLYVVAAAAAVHDFIRRFQASIPYLKIQDTSSQKMQQWQRQPENRAAQICDMAQLSDEAGSYGSQNSRIAK